MTSAAYPGALDALANPGPTTETDDAGYELDIVVARLQNCIMAIEGKLGIGTGGPPASNAVLRRTATGTSAWGLVTTNDITANNISQAIVKNSSGAFAAVGVAWTGDASGLIQAITTSGGPVIALARASMSSDIAARYTRLAIFRDTIANQIDVAPHYNTAAGVGYSQSLMGIDVPAAGTYNYFFAAQANEADNTSRWFGDSKRTLLLIELKR